jgi:hypothetical protein
LHIAQDVVAGTVFFHIHATREEKEQLTFGCIDIAELFDLLHFLRKINVALRDKKFRRTSLLRSHVLHIDEQSNDRVLRFVIEELATNGGAEPNELHDLLTRTEVTLPQEGEERRGEVTQYKLRFGVRCLVPNVDHETARRVLLGLFLWDLVRVKRIPLTVVLVPATKMSAKNETEVESTHQSCHWVT